MKWTVAGLCLVLLVTACGSPSPTQTPSPTEAHTPTQAPAPTDGAITAVEIAPAGVLLTAVGQTKQLTAIARTSAGLAVPATVTWSSSDDAIAAIDTSGTLRAVAALGTAMITAAVGDVRSLPTYVTIAQPVDGAVLLNDTQIVGGPSAVDQSAEPSADTAYEVVLRGVTGATPGAILINAEGLPVAGRVVSVTAEGGDSRVRLVVVPPGELFSAVEFEDTVDLGAGPFEVPDDLAAAYDIVQTGSSFVFTPKVGVSVAPPPPGLASAVLAHWPAFGRAPLSRAGRLAQVQGTRVIPFTDCEFEPNSENLPLPLKLSAPPAFTFTAAGSVTRQLTAAGTDIVVRATPTMTFESVLEVEAAFEAKVECKRTLVVRRFRAPGWAGLFFGGDIEFGVGFEIAGKVVVLSAKVGGRAELNPTFSATLSCPTGGDCALSGNATADSRLEPVVETPALNQLRFEPSVNLFAFITLEAGNADVDQLQFEAIEAKAGIELAASLTFEGLQIDNTDAEDGRSKYELAFKGEVGPGVKVGDFLEALGLDVVELLKLEFEVPLGASPTGTVTADEVRYLPGDHVTVTVTLDSASTIFPRAVGLYNVERVVIVRRSGLSTQTLAEVAAGAGMTTFDVAFDSPGLIDAGELFAFVATKLPLPVNLEIGAAVPPGITPGTFAGTVRVTILGDSRNSSNVGNYMNATFVYDLSVTVDREGTPTAAVGTVRVTEFDAKENGEGCKSDFTFSGSGTQPQMTWSPDQGSGDLTARVTGTYTEAKRCSGGSTDDDTGRVGFDVPVVTWVPEYDSNGELVALVFDGDRRADAGIGVGESDVRLRWTGRLTRVP
jgi:hypothetical protein